MVHLSESISKKHERHTKKRQALENAHIYMHIHTYIHTYICICMGLRVLEWDL